MASRSRVALQVCFVAVYAVVSTAGSIVAGCSSDDSDSPDQSEAAPNNLPPASGSTAGMSGAPAGPSSSGTPPGQQAMGPMANAGSGGEQPMAGGQAPGPDTTGDADPMVDCTPVEWNNPGMVEDPEVVAVPADAGTGVPYDQIPSMEEIEKYDYVMEEFFFTGTSPAYTSRMVVRRPRDPAKFSGTVFAEWYNVSGQIDFAVLWANSREYFMREGHVFVGVSAQAVGANALKTYDAERYAMIQHPGDTSAGAIFSQAGVAIHLQSEKLLGPCMPVRAVIALGQSQSSGQLAQYVNNRHPPDKVYEGFMLHSGGEPSTNDPGTPTFVVFTMSEGNGSLSDGPTLMEWMVAGATHNDGRVTMRGATLPAGNAMQTAIECLNPLNQFPSYRAYNAALDWLHRWVRDGEKPPAGTPFEGGAQLALDEHMNGLGGVRLPDIEVPIATYGFDNGPADPLDFIGYLACGLGGTTIPFTEAKLLQLYPTHEDYVMQYTAAADAALASGYLLQADYDEAIRVAQDAPIPN